MDVKQSSEYYKGRKNLVFATLISVPGPLLLAISMAAGSSATQTADLIRRSCEFLTVFLAWLVYEFTVCRAQDAGRARLEAFVRYFTGLSMALSGAVMVYVAIVGFGGEKGSILPSLILALIGATVNARLYSNYRTMDNAVLSVQAKLHRVKMLLDCFMTLLLFLWMLIPVEVVRNYADLIGSCCISLYLIWSGSRVLAGK